MRPLIISSNFSRSSASFATGPWVPSYTQLQAAALSSSYTLPETQTSPSSYVKEPANPRYIFSDAELEILTRNGEEILQLHEHFVRELRVILEPLGLTMDPHSGDGDYTRLDNLDVAIRIVSTKFATEVRSNPISVCGIYLYQYRLRVSMHISPSAPGIQKLWISLGKLISSFR